MYYVYMLKNDFEKLYIGATEDVNARLRYHNSQQGAQFTKGKAKFRVVFMESYNSFDEARRREVQLKKWRRDKNEMLIRRFQTGLSTK